MLVRMMRSYRMRKKRYLTEDASVIANTNKRFLVIASTVTAVLYIVFLLLAKILFAPTWQPSIFHVAYFPFVLIFALYAHALNRNKSASHRTVTASCIAFELLIYVLVILIDTIAAPNAPGSFTELVCMALPALFILPERFTLGLLFLAEGAYLGLILTIKNPAFASNDIFSLVAGLTFSICISLLVSSFRLDAYDIRSKFERLSNRDTLSSLYNKRAFSEMVDNYLARYNGVVDCSLAFIDIDNFKQLNDELGHTNGDRVLSLLGDVLNEQFRSNDIVGRFGGDEFLVFLDRFNKQDLLENRFANINSQFCQRVEELLGRSCHLSIGVVYTKQDRASLSSLIGQADDALYAAKRQGKNCAVIKRFVPDPTDNA